MQRLSDLSSPSLEIRQEDLARVRYLRDLSNIDQIPAAERELLEKVAENTFSAPTTTTCG